MTSERNCAHQEAPRLEDLEEAIRHQLGTQGY